MKIKITIWSILAFIWGQRELILAIIPLAITAQQTFKVNPDKKSWVKQQLETVKAFTPEEVDYAIDATVQLLQWLRVL
jgi:hypothetical protein